MVLRYFTAGDIVLIVGILLCSAVGFFSVHELGITGKHVVVDVDGKRVLEVPLDRDTVQTVRGPLGDTVIVVEDGAVRVAASPCPLHYCERMGSIRHRGEIIVCVPNRIIVSIRGGGGGESFDGVTQ